MSNLATELVIQPPPFKLTAARSSKDGNRFSARVVFETPHGPAALDVAMEIPELYRSLAVELFHKALQKAVLAHIAWQHRQQVSAGFLGLKIPNPAKIVAKAAKAITKKAKAAVNVAYNLLPGPVKAVAGPILKQVASAANPTVLFNLVKPLVKKLGGTKIPGTDIPIMALSPIGAAAFFGQQIIGKKATNELLDEAYNTAQAIVSSPNDATKMWVPDGASAGALPRIKAPGASPNRPPPISVKKAVGTAAVAQKAKTLASAMATNAQFAKEVGLPTLNVQPDLHDAGRILVQTLRGVYLGNPDQRKRLETLANKAREGDPSAKMLWKLALDISDAARDVRSGSAVGDGFGPGYGMTGYGPPAPSALFRLSSKRSTLLERGSACRRSPFFL